MSGSQSLPALGTLNRALVHITFASFPALNIGIQNMGKSLAQLSFEGDFNYQADVAVGLIPSPEPFVPGVINVSVLRTTALGNAWYQQLFATTTLGTVVVYPDTTAFSSTTLANAVVRSFDPGAYDGVDAVIKMTIRGAIYPNNDMWS